MKKILIGLAATVALSSTAALADTQAVKEMNDYSHILEVANKNREASSRPSEFVIYHQDSHRPCPPEHAHGKGKHHHHEMEHKAEHHHKHEGEHHHHHHHHHDGMKKKSDEKKAQKPAVSEQTQKPAEGSSAQ